jgi:squalene-hopene/tetraprenyl-beta-curcumene cyclase
MKTLLSLVGVLSLLVSASGADNATPSLKAETLQAITRGLDWLQHQQKPDGSFANPLNGAAAAEHPALTALPLIALQRGLAGGFVTAVPPETMSRGYAYLRSKAQVDGGIYGKGLSNYNTSVCLIALLGANDPQNEPLITAARAFVAGQQATNMAKPELNGGFGYGPVGTSPKRQHPDLDNTLVALEALAEYKKARPAAELAAGKDLNWQAAIDFVSRCQNLPSHNHEAWASDDPANKGGFVYYPGSSNAGEQKLPDGKIALRSYGTISYAGLLSFIYADLQKDDPRVTAAVDWLGRNYSNDENPGLGRQGLFYYYHLAVRGLGAAGVEQLTRADGTKIDWRSDLAHKVVAAQNADGSWVNDAARWMETDPVLVTSYCVMALESLAARL